MPDWLSHVLLGLVICEIFNIRKKSLVLIGAVLPDILRLSKLLTFFPVDSSSTYKIFFPLHTPIGSLVLACLVALLFDYKYVAAVWLLSIGWISHFFLDVFQRHLGFGENLLFFPLSWNNLELGVVAINQFYYVLIPLIVAYLIVRAVWHVRQSKNY
jgi:hypothetical protein